jgi:hypothetical protein
MESVSLIIEFAGEPRRIPHTLVQCTKHQERAGYALASPTERKAPRWNAQQADAATMVAKDSNAKRT